MRTNVLTLEIFSNLNFLFLSLFFSCLSTFPLSCLQKRFEHSLSAEVVGGVSWLLNSLYTIFSSSSSSPQRIYIYNPYYISAFSSPFCTLISPPTPPPLSLNEGWHWWMLSRRMSSKVFSHREAASLSHVWKCVLQYLQLQTCSYRSAQSTRARLSSMLWI